MKAWRNPDVASFSAALPDFISGKRTPRQFLESCLDVIAARDRTVKAFVTVNARGARRAADAATKRYRAGKPLSPVDGMPVAIKDIIATADMPTQMDCPAFKGWQSGQDAACVAALRSGGAVIIGKTVTTEFAIGYTGSRTFLIYGSWLGLPAFALPLLQVNGLPVGIRLLGAPGGDGALCAAANWFLKSQS